MTLEEEEDAETRALIWTSGQVRGSGYVEREDMVGESGKHRAQKSGNPKAWEGWGDGIKKRTAG